VNKSEGKLKLRRGSANNKERENDLLDRWSRIGHTRT
jgi:hypothetical protein